MTFSATPDAALIQAHELFANVDSGITENVIIRTAFLAMPSYMATVEKITVVAFAIMGYDDNESTRRVFDIEKHCKKLVRAGVLRTSKTRMVVRYELALKF